jgi:hypothetical protein
MVMLSDPKQARRFSVFGRHAHVVHANIRNLT